MGPRVVFESVFPKKKKHGVSSSGVVSQHISYLSLSVGFVNLSNITCGETSFMFGRSALMKTLYFAQEHTVFFVTIFFVPQDLGCFFTTGCLREHVENKALTAKS